MKIRGISLACTVAACCYTHTASALENGTTSYPSGLMTVMSGLLGDPGTYAYSYNKFQSIRSLRGGNGEASPPGVDGSLQAHAIRMVHVFEEPVLGGNLALQAAIPYVDGTLHFSSFGFSSGGRGFGDPMFGVLLGWKSPALFQTVELDLVPRMGSYDKNRVFNPGNNANTVYLAYSFTWFPVRELEVSSKINLNISGENPATNYRSGVQLVADYGINYHIGRIWLVGIGGYLATQLTDDKQNGAAAFGDGHRTKSITVGPQVGFGTPQWGAFLSWQRSVYSRNAASTDTVWLNGYLKF